ncbi:hypothetical protein BS630_23400 [Rhizobium laguerreae]|nr:hypothetical protein BS630_23400 [Rhizobium laguerreae]
MGLRDLQNARWRRSAAKMPENKEIGGGEGHEGPLERKDDGEFCAHRQGRAALSGPRAKTVPPNLAGIYQKGRKTSRFRSSKPTDNGDLRVKSINHR